LSGSDEGVPFDVATVRGQCGARKWGGKTGKNSGIMQLLIDLPKMQYQAGIVWVKFIGTHVQYDRIDVETVNDY
jgi:mRNA interferase HigB